MLKTDHFAQAQFSYNCAVDGVRVYCILCSEGDWEHAQAVKDSLFAYLDVSLDEVAHGFRMKELAHEN